MSEPRANERNDQHVRENLHDPGPLAEVKVSEQAAGEAREALKKSTPKGLKK